MIRALVNRTGKGDSISKKNGYKPFFLFISIGSAYFLFARLGLLLATVNGSSSPVWPATGISILCLYYFGIRFAPAIAIGALCANFLSGTPIFVSSGIALGNAAEGIAGAWILTRFLQRRAHFAFHYDALVSILASVLPALISATFGNFALASSGIIAWTNAGSSWITWFVGDALGALFFVPIACFAPDKKSLSVQLGNLLRSPWGIVSLAAAVSLTTLAFRLPAGHSLAFGLILTLYPGALRRDPLSTIFAALCVAAVAILETKNGVGPFQYGDLNTKLINLQLFLSTFAITAVTLPGLLRVDNRRVPLITLVAGWAIATSVFFAFKKSEANKDQQHFQILVDNLRVAIETRVAFYEDALRAGVSLFRASDYVSALEWHEFQKTLGVYRRYPGVNGIGVIFPVKPINLKSFQQDLQLKEVPDFEVHWLDQPSSHSSQDHYIITYIEPKIGNEAAIGLDIASEPKRKAAADLARDTGRAAISAPVELVQDAKRGAAFLMLFPIYAKDFDGNATPEERRAAFRSWVYSPFIAEKFFFEATIGHADEIAFTVRDGESDLYKSPSKNVIDHGAKSHMQLIIGQRRLDFLIQETSGFVNSQNVIGAWVAFWSGIVVLLTTGVIVVLQNASSEAKLLVTSRTAELSRVEKANRLAAAASKAGFFYVNPLTDEVRYSDEARQILGLNLTNDRHLDRAAMFKAIDPEHVETVRTTMQNFFLGKTETATLEYRLNSPLHGHIWIRSVMNATERDPEGLPSSIVGFCQDVTDIKSASERVAKSERQLKFALEGSSDGIWDWDIKASEIYFSSQLAETFGSPSTIKLQTPTDMQAVVHPDDFARTEASITAHLTGQTEIHESQARLKLKDGSWKWFLTRGKISERDLDGTPTRMTGVHIDISRLKATEKLLEDSRNELVKATQAKSQFFATMSHEIRTPLNGILGMANLLADTKLDEEQKKFTDVLVTSGKALFAVVNDVLDFSRMDAGKTQLERAPFSLAQLTRSQIDLLRPEADKHGITLQADIEPDLNVNRMGDPGRIAQLMLNLLNNAIKFTPQGSVTIKLRSAGAAPMVRVEVIDTGIGLSEDQIGILFEPFVQADGSTSRKYGGTGLGLSICKRLCELMGGRIGVISSLGSGSTFWFELPLDLAERPVTTLTKDSQAHSASELSAFHILVAEDNEPNQILIRKLLQKIGCACTIVNNGKDVLTALKSQTFDAILMDCQMPEQDGYETTRRIRAGETPNATIPIIALTANAMIDDERACLAAGMDAFLTKPIARAKLAEMLKNHLIKPGPPPQSETPS